MSDEKSVRRVCEVGQGDSVDRRDLGRVHCPHRCRLAPPAKDRSDNEAAGRYPQIGENGEYGYPGGVQPGLLSCLAHRCSDWPVVLGIERTTGKRRLSRVRSHGVGTLNDQHIVAVLGLTEEHQHC